MKKHITDFAPGDIAGFDIAGWLQEDGTIILTSSKEVLTEIPQEIELNKMTYTYEQMFKFAITEQGQFINLQYV
jgi:hypothetical protein